MKSGLSCNLLAMIAAFSPLNVHYFIQLLCLSHQLEYFHNCLHNCRGSQIDTSFKATLNYYHPIQTYNKDTNVHLGEKSELSLKINYKKTKNIKLLIPKMFE